jgi:hypothetical protein
VIWKIYLLQQTTISKKMENQLEKLKNEAENRKVPHPSKFEPDIDPN